MPLPSHTAFRLPRESLLGGPLPLKFWQEAIWSRDFSVVVSLLCNSLHREVCLADSLLSFRNCAPYVVVLCQKSYCIWWDWANFCCRLLESLLYVCVIIVSFSCFRFRYIIICIWKPMHESLGLVSRVLNVGNTSLFFPTAPSPPLHFSLLWRDKNRTGSSSLQSYYCPHSDTLTWVH